MKLSLKKFLFSFHPSKHMLHCLRKKTNNDAIVTTASHIHTMPPCIVVFLFYFHIFLILFVFRFVYKKNQERKTKSIFLICFCFSFPISRTHFNHPKYIKWHILKMMKANSAPLFSFIGRLRLCNPWRCGQTLCSCSILVRC